MSASGIHFLDKDLVNKQAFTSSGTFNVPKGITRVLVHGWGGGQGGGNAFFSGTNQPGNGGRGAHEGWRWVDVTPGDAISVTIGAGGDNNAGSGADGGPGGDTIFGSLVTFKGADIKRGIPQGLGGDSAPGEDGEGNAFYLGGAGATGGTDNGGGGGAGPGGNGGNGAFGGSDGGSGAANSGAGGGAAGQNGNFGGDGGSGYCEVFWVDPQ